jgi:hypothetical protein
MKMKFKDLDIIENSLSPEAEDDYNIDLDFSMEIKSKNNGKNKTIKGILLLNKEDQEWLVENGYLHLLKE